MVIKVLPRTLQLQVLAIKQTKIYRLHRTHSLQYNVNNEEFIPHFNGVYYMTVWDANHYNYSVIRYSWCSLSYYLFTV